MKEIWKEINWIKGYEGLYQISNLGNVISNNYRHKKEEHQIKTFVNKHGYFAVVLKANGNQKNMLVHRLVATAFIENPNNFPLVNHKDEDKKNNSVDNLEWCTHKYNINYSMEKRGKNYNSQKRKRQKFTPHKHTKKVRQINTNEVVIKEYENVSEAARLNHFSLKSLIDCCNGKRKTAHGFKWEFVI